MTRILEAIQAGQRQAAEELLPLVYGELRCIAAAKMAQERPGQTLQPTALVHEAWLRLGGDAALEVAVDAPTEQLLAVHEALERLAAEDRVAADVVNLRYFVGLPLPEVAQVLRVSPRTASRLWAYARVRLKEIIRGGPD